MLYDVYIYPFQQASQITKNLSDDNTTYEGTAQDALRTPAEVAKTIRFLKTNKAPGDDNVAAIAFQRMI